MAAIIVPADLLMGDGLPPVCYRTGQPTQDRLRVNFRTLRVPWVLLVVALLGAVVPFVIVYLLASIEAGGTLPASAEVRSARRRARLAAWGVALLGVVLIILAIVVTNGWLALTGLVLIVVVAPPVAFALRGRVLPKATVYRDDNRRKLVRLEGVAPAFAEAARGIPGVTVLGPAGQPSLAGP